MDECPQRYPRGSIGRREFVSRGSAAAGLFVPGHSAGLAPIVVSVRALVDQGAHSGKGLSEIEVSRFKAYQEKARREYAASGIVFELTVVEGAFLRKQGYSEIPSRFMATAAINLFITGSPGYDVDRDRTGGCSIGPLGRRPGFAGDPFYKTFLGLREAQDTTLAHEYAHHFTLDTRRNPTGAGNVWADLRNDYWLWRQRHGLPITGFRACAHSVWAILDASS